MRSKKETAPEEEMPLLTPIHSPIVPSSEAPDFASMDGLSRRDLLIGGCACVLAWSAYSCGWIESAEQQIGLLSDLDKEGFLIGEFNDHRTFTSRDSSGQLYTLNLTCTHRQCTVRWQSAVRQFVCPCHKGQYDAMGQRISGKPPRNLYRFPTEIRNNDQIWVLNQPF